MKLKNKIIAGLLGLTLMFCSCADSSSGISSSEASSSQSETITTTNQTTLTTQSTQSEQTTTTTTTTAQSSETETRQTTVSSSGTTTSSSEKDPDVSVPEGVPMWEGSDKDGNKMVFLGSMHAAKDDFYPIPEKIKKAYDEAEVVAFECDTENAESEDSQRELQKQMTYSDGTLLKDRISPEAYKILCERLAELDVTEELVANFRPWAAYETLTAVWMMSSDIAISNGIDYYLMRQTKSDGKQLYELESEQAQLDMVIKQPEKLYDALLRLMKNQTKKIYLDETTQLYKLWLKGDLEGLEAMSVLPSDEDLKKEGMTDEDIKLLKERDKVQVADRNVGMAAKIKELFKNGKKTMVVVGSAHYTGEKGIISLLQKEGYTFKRI